MGRYILTWSLLVLGLCAATVTTAQTDDGIETGDPGTGGRHTIQGRLYLPSGRKLDRRLRVRLSSIRGGENSTLTGDDGAFTFRRLAAGTYTVTVEGGREFETATETVDIIAGSRQSDESGQVYTVQIRLEEKRAAADPARPGVVRAGSEAVPAEARARYEKALAASASGDHKQAVRELKAALEIHPQFPLALNELGAQYMVLGQLTDAADAFASAIKLAPDEPVLRINHGILLIRQKKYREAEEQLARAVALDEKSAEARVHRGHALIRLGRGAEAEAELRAAVKLGGPATALGHRYLGALYFERGDDARAAAELEEYLRLAPAAADAAQVRAILAGLKPTNKR
ncbi:MAG: protein O-mannosyl-transferase [Acidobacteriota bacterium]|jgi:Flp pilus assembly protein TadD|nr:protein O-mannosyl-transferase [Acidobacteriota bacterium]